jgi:RNA polymerase sigma factor (sigma-70 family)
MKRLRLTANQELQLADLDALLDLPVERFDREVARLARSFLQKRVRVAIPPQRRPGRHSNVVWTEAYEADVSTLPRMDRAEEFLMARRYEFLKHRLRAVMEDLGFDEAAIAHSSTSAGMPDDAVIEAVLRKRRKLSSDAARAEAIGYLRTAIEELRALRALYLEGGLYMVLATVHRYRGLGVDLIDLIQEGNASLFQAIEGFDWRRDVRFRTYAQFWIQQAILKVLYNASRTVRVPIWVQKALKKIQRVRDSARAANGVEASDEVVASALGMSAARVQELQRVRRYAVSLDAESPDDEGGSLAQTLADENSVPVPENIAEDDLGARLGEALADLPERERLILHRRFGLGGGDVETLGDIASDLGITAERVRQLQNAALDRLRKPRKLHLLRAFAG